MFYEDNKLKQKYYEEFATLFIANGFGEEGETVEDIIDILNKKGKKFVITDTSWKMERAANWNGNIFLSPSDKEDKKTVFHEIFHTLVDEDNRNGLHFKGLKEDFSDFENYGVYANEGAINCLVAKMLNLEYIGEVSNIDSRRIRYKMDSYIEPTRVMEQVDFFVGSKCLVRAMRFNPQILYDEFDKIAGVEGAFASIRDKLDNIKDIVYKLDIKKEELNDIKAKGEDDYGQSIKQEFKSYLDEACELFQSAQAITVYNCFTKKIKEANNQKQVNDIISKAYKFVSLGLAENSDSFEYLLQTLANQKSTSSEWFQEVIFDAIEDIRQGELNDISNNIRSDLTLEENKYLAEEKKGESK